MTTIRTELTRETAAIYRGRELCFRATAHGVLVKLKGSGVLAWRWFREIHNALDGRGGNRHVAASLLRAIRVLFLRDVGNYDFAVLCVMKQPAHRATHQRFWGITVQLLPLG